MTQEDWLLFESPGELLAAARYRASDRKLRLFACACCRAYWHAMDEPQRLAVEAGERFAERHGKLDDLAPHRAAAMGVASGTGRTAAEAALAAAERLARSTMPEPPLPPGVGPWMGYYRQRPLPEDFHARMCPLARCVLAPNAPRLDPAWCTPDAAMMALAAYEERSLPSGELDPLRLSILADALEEAGASEEIVAHLRSPGPHVRGCWVLDLILAKE